MGRHLHNPLPARKRHRHPPVRGIDRRPMDARALHRRFRRGVAARVPPPAALGRQVPVDVRGARARREGLKAAIRQREWDSANFEILHIA